jgi:tetrahydromethanopterin S-methyltransferase subunit G
MLVEKYPVQLEFNPVLRRLLTIDKRLVFAWIPVEYTALLGLYYLNKKVRERLGVKKRLEYVVVAVAAIAVLSNVVGLIATYIASILSTIRLFLPA